MLKKLLLISLFLGFLRAEGEHYEIIAELSKAFLKAKEVLTAINKTYKNLY